MNEAYFCRRHSRGFVNLVTSVVSYGEPDSIIIFDRVFGFFVSRVVAFPRGAILPLIQIIDAWLQLVYYVIGLSWL